MIAVDRKMAVGLLTASAAVLTSIAQWEGSEPVARPDPVGIPTACHGHTKGVVNGQRFTPSQCAVLLREDASYAGQAIARCTTVELTQGQYDALVSFVFNVGGSAYCRSTLARKLNAGDCMGAAGEFIKWDRAGGQRLPGLTRRRQAEQAQFARGCTA